MHVAPPVDRKMASKGMFFPTWPKEKECVFEGCICCYSICDLDTAKILICGRGEDLYICFEDKFCCVSGDTPFPVGLIKDDSYICKLGLYCYMCGLKNPDMKKLFACDYHCLCYKCIGQFPLGGKGAALAFPPSHFPPSHTLCHILSDCVHAPPVRPQSRSRCARTTGSPAFRRLAASCPRRSLPVAPPPRPSRWPAKLTQRTGVLKFRLRWFSSSRT